jgi:hypothetical protein
VGAILGKNVQHSKKINIEMISILFRNSRFRRACIAHLTLISPLKNVCMPNTSKLLFKSHTTIGFYFKTMSAHGHRTQFWKYTTQGPSMPWPPSKMAAFSGHTVVLTYDPMGKNVLKSSPLKLISQYSKHGRSGSQDIILKVDHLRTIHPMFALNWLTGFRGEDF